MNSESTPTRTYKQGARAKAAAETAERIMTAFAARLETGWLEEVRLEDVAADAGVTVQTVIRRFGGKDGLLAATAEKMEREIVSHRAMPRGDISTAIDIIIEEYELHGDLVMRMLAQEDRFPAVRAMTDQGRRSHREWTGAIFAPWLERMEEDRKTVAHDRLVIALDLYVWKLVRIDMKRSTAALKETMLTMAASALGIEIGALKEQPAL